MTLPREVPLRCRRRHSSACACRWILLPTTVVYLALYFAQGGASSDFGLIKNIRSLTIIPLNQAAYRRTGECLDPTNTPALPSI